MNRIDAPLYLDGEKIPEGQFDDIFREPPNIHIHRNTLLVGSRGAGKTVYLKHIARSNSDALYISSINTLTTVLSDIIPHPSKKWDSDLNSVNPVADFLFSLQVIEIAYAKGYRIPLANIKTILPRKARPRGREGVENFISRIRLEIANRTLKTTELARGDILLREVLEVLSESASSMDRGLQVLFDRVDSVPISGVLPTFHLLDQTQGQYTAIIATRPAPNGNPDWGVRPYVVPNDHYDVMTVGRLPRGDAWQDFVRSAVQAQVEAFVKTHIPQSIIDAITYVARDSIRSALELASRVTGAPNAETALESALAHAQQSLLDRASARLRPWQPRFVNIPRSWRTEAEKQLNGPVDRPIEIQLSSGTSDYLPGLVPTPSPAEEFIASCLECGVAHPSHGDSWIPGKRLSVFEANPLLMWKRGDVLEGAGSKPSLRISLSASQLQGGRGGGPSWPKPAKVFVALRFDFPESLEFLDTLDRKLRGFRELQEIVLYDGRVPGGSPWPVEIRERIRKATTLAIGDVTGPRPDPLFELGVAAGLNRPIIPVVSKINQIKLLPFWLRSFQIRSYQDEKHYSALLGDIHSHIYERPIPAIGLPRSSPEIVSFIGSSDTWHEAFFSQVERTVRSASLHWKGASTVEKDNYEDCLQNVARSWLAVMVFDGSPQDDFVSFAAGTLVGKPMAGTGRRKIERRILILARDASIAIPESLQRCQQVITVSTDPGTLIEQLNDAIARQQEWRRSIRDS